MSGARVQRLRIGVGIAVAILLALPLPAAAAVAASDRVALADPGSSATSDWIVTLKPGVEVRASSDIARAAGGRTRRLFSHALHGFAFHGSAAAVAALRRNPNVRTIVPDGKISIADTIPTGISRIRANHPTDPSAYSLGFTGKGVKVAILDTGIDLTHPDLVPNLDTALGRNCITSGPPQDGHGHGTHVAGIVAAANNGLGVVGVAPEATLVPIKVLDDTGQGQWSNLICAIDYLTGLMTDGDPTNDVRVANMSLGDTGSVGSCTDGFVREAICHSVAAGIVYVAAAGNSTVNVSTFIPAAFPEVIAVSALTDLDGEPGGHAGCLLFFFYCDDTLAEFSNYGAGIAVAAPGTQIYSDWTGGGYATEDGTSMASPHVAGVAALILAANPSFTPATVEALIKRTGECPNGAFADSDGSGTCVGKGQRANDPDGIAEPLVNALHAMSGSTPPPPTVPGVPVGVTATSQANQVGLSWTAPASDGRSPITGYRVYRSTSSGSETLLTSLGVVTSYTDTAVTNGTAYFYRVSAVNAVGESSLSAETSATPVTQLPPPPVDNPGVQGNWVGTYGADGYILPNWNNNNTDLSSLPAGVTYSLDQGARATWASSTTEVRALTSPSGTDRRAPTFYDVNTLRLRLTFTNAYSGTLHLYALDWDAYGGNRYENVSLNDGNGLQTATLSNSFVQGAWIHAPINVAAGGSVIITAVKTAGNTAVLAGLFLGGSSPPTVPGAPTGLAATPGDGQVALTWAAPASDGRSPITGYTATASPGGATCSTATLGCTVSGLTNGTSYSFTVKATNAVGTGPASAPASATPVTQLPPPPVDNPGVQGNWVGTYGADGYILPNWNNNNTDLSSLPAGVTYSLDQGARATWASSTTEVRALTSPSGTDRRAPTFYDVNTLRLRLTFTNAYSGTLHLYALDWDAYGGNRYENVSLNDGNGLQTATLSNSFVQGAWIHAPINVAAGGSVIITAVKTAGNTAVLAGLFLGGSSPPTVPGAPTGLAATPGDGQVALTWAAPASDGRSPITGYTATASPGGATCSTATLGCTVSGLTNGTSYSFTVKATNAVGTGPASAPASATPVTQLPPPPVDNPGVQGNWVGTYGADGYILPNWNNNNTDLSSLPAGVTYSLDQGARATWASSTTEVRALTSPSGTDRRAPTFYDVNTLRLRLTFTNAYSGTLHLYALDWDAYGGNRYENVSLNDGNGLQTATLSNSFVQGAWIHAPINVAAGGSVIITAVKTAGNTAVLAGLFLGGSSPPTVPGAPTGLAATPGDGQVALTWAAPASNGGSAITGYRVYRSTSSGSEALLTTLGVVTTYTDTALTNGTTYFYQVSAVNAVGEGTRSTEASATPAAPPPTAPGAPTGLAATPGNAQVGLSWTAPASNGGSAITGYRVYRSTSSGSEALLTTLGVVTTYTDTALTNGTTYFYQVSAVNAVGEGTRSTEASATPAAPPPTAPGAPTGLAATPGNAQVGLSWTAPASNGGSAITGYRVYRSTSSGSEALLTTLGVVTTYTDTALTNGTTYFYQVSAVNAVGEGTRSTEASAKPATVPGVPRNVNATKNATLGVTLAWAAPTSNGGSAITGYRIYRSTTSGGETFLVAVGNVTSYVDTATTRGVRYYYQVSAVNAVGEGVRSAQTSAIAR